MEEPGLYGRIKLKMIVSKYGPRISNGIHLALHSGQWLASVNTVVKLVVA